jgi:hypothetical protein
MDTELVEKAVEKLMRGPTSTTWEPKSQAQQQQQQ